MPLSPERKNYFAIMSMIGSGHAMSHFYLLALPPLFPLLKTEFDVSYAALGLLITGLNASSALSQIPAGLLVDRIGARKVLIFGLSIAGLSVAAIGAAPSYIVVLVLITLAGVGNSVLHPCDYAILNASVDPKRVGRAFAVHTFSGNIGFTLAPMTMALLSVSFGWRAALVIVGLFVLIIVAALIRFGSLLVDEKTLREREAKLDTSGSQNPPDTGLRPLLSPVILVMFLFFMCSAMVTSGVQSFSVTALIGHQEIGLGEANTVLTAFLVASSLGVLLGGPLADKTTRHGTLAASAMIGGAILFAVIGSVGLGVALLIICFAGVGIMQGAVRPSRDMMVRAVTPKGASGRVFAFVSTGLNVGAAITPVLFGYLIDIGRPETVFYLLAFILTLSIATIGVARSRKPVPAPAE